MRTKKVKIEVIFWRDCPSWSEAIERVKRAIRQIEDELNRKDLFELIIKEVKTEDEAHKTGFRGSPTILVDGKDIDETHLDINPVGLTCRTYLVDGKMLPLPPYEYIYRTIKRAVEVT